MAKGKAALGAPSKTMRELLVKVLAHEEADRPRFVSSRSATAKGLVRRGLAVLGQDIGHGRVQLHLTDYGRQTARMEREAESAPDTGTRVLSGRKVAGPRATNVSRHLQKHGLPTRSSRRHEGVRVTGWAEGVVHIEVDVQGNARAASVARYVAEALDASVWSYEAKYKTLTDDVLGDVPCYTFFVRAAEH